MSLGLVFHYQPPPPPSAFRQWPLPHQWGELGRRCENCGTLRANPSAKCIRPKRADEYEAELAKMRRH